MPITVPIPGKQYEPIHPPMAPPLIPPAVPAMVAAPLIPV